MPGMEPANLRTSGSFRLGVRGTLFLTTTLRREFFFFQLVHGDQSSREGTLHPLTPFLLLGTAIFCREKECAFIRVEFPEQMLGYWPSE